MSKKNLWIGDECLVFKYESGFEGHRGFWGPFHGVIKKVNERTAIISIADSAELTPIQKRISNGKLSVALKFIDGKIRGQRPQITSQVQKTNARTQQAVDEAHERRLVLGEQLKRLYTKGFTQIEASRLLGKSGKMIQNAQHAVGIPTPVRYRARFVNIEGEVQYFISVGEAAEKLHVGRARLVGSDRIELLNGVYEHADWIEFEGSYHKLHTAAETAAAFES